METLPTMLLSLAKIATPETSQRQAHVGQNGYVHGLTIPVDTTPPKVLSRKTLPEGDALPDRPNSGQQAIRIDGETFGNQCRSTKGVWRPRSVGHSPLTPSRRSGFSGNSKSCPPARLKSSPIKDVIKHGGKTRKDLSPGTECVKRDYCVQKGKQSGPPLRRAGLDTSRKLNFFKKPNEMLRQSQGITQLAEKIEGDALMIDVESITAADEIRKQTIAVEQVRDAGAKWLCEYPDEQRNAVEQLAVRVLLTMNSTLRFFTVAMRMLSRAPWTEAMISLNVRQSALVAISRGWFVKDEGACKYPFTRAELALAAGAYEGLLTPTVPDDTTVALRTIIDHLPIACDAMFTRAEVTCPFCHAKRDGIVPTFSSSITWKDQAWSDLKHALARAQPFVGHLPRGWRAEGCNRDDQIPKLTKLGEWLYLELRPYPVLRNDFFPFLSESISLISDDSLCTEGLYVDCLVCSNLSAGEGRHYWLVEVSGGRIRQAYDSLQGVQLLTQEVYRMLQVTGVLFRSANCGKPTLRNPKLDQIAGKIETVVRRAPPIKVASRSKTCKTKRELVKSMSNLGIVPTKLNFFSRKLERKVEGLGEGLSLRCRPRRSIAVYGPKNKRAHCASQTKRRTKGKIQPKRTRKAPPAVSKPQKGIGDLLGRPSSGSQCRRENVVQPEDNLVDSASEVEIPQREASQPKDNGEIGKTDASEGGPGAASDPISDFLTQGGGSGGSPPRERKRTFAQAELEELSSNPKTTEDDLRRMQGPPRAHTEASLAQPVGQEVQTTGNQVSTSPCRTNRTRVTKSQC